MQNEGSMKIREIDISNKMTMQINIRTKYANLQKEKVFDYGGGLELSMIRLKSTGQDG